MMQLVRRMAAFRATASPVPDTIAHVRSGTTRKPDVPSRSEGMCVWHTPRYDGGRYGTAVQVTSRIAAECDASTNAGGMATVARTTSRAS